MKPASSHYSSAAYLLVIFGILLLLIAGLLTDRADITTATLILAGVACFFSGIFLFAFQKRETGISPGLASMLAVPGTMNQARLFADLGVAGKAHFIPVGDHFPADVMQFNPVADEAPETVAVDFSYCTGNPGTGILTVPSGSPLLMMIERDHALTLPATESDLIEAIREVFEEILEVATPVKTSRSGDTISVELKNFMLISGCRAVREQSPEVCLMAPCPTCNLIGVMLAKGLGKKSTIQQITVDDKRKAVVVTVSVRE
jgi:hypothetical protein